MVGRAVVEHIARVERAIQNMFQEAVDTGRNFPWTMFAPTIAAQTIRNDLFVYERGPDGFMLIEVF